MKMLLLQQALRIAGLYAGALDGKRGGLTQAAVTTALSVANITTKGWDTERQDVGAFQTIMAKLGFNPGNVDGRWGPQTQFAADTFEYWLETKKRPDDWRTDGQDTGLPDPAPLSAWPRQQDAELRRFFGDPGQNQVSLELPWVMKLAWDKAQVIRRFSCHEKVHDSMLWALTAIGDAYSENQREAYGFNLFGGCLNVRQMRGGSALSTHSWGIAIDFDPERNQLRWGRDKAYLARPECDRFRQIWKEAGALSLGETRNYDWMHFQFARL